MYISPNVLQISLGGRIVSAHRRQLKIPEDSRRLPIRRFVLNGESSTQLSAEPSNSNNARNSNKRKRGEESMSEDSDSDFYGFAADSFLFEEISRFDRQSFQSFNSTDPATTSEQRAVEANPEGNVQPTSSATVNRHSKRRNKKRRLHDYVYY